MKCGLVLATLGVSLKLGAESMMLYLAYLYARKIQLHDGPERDEPKSFH